MGLLGGLLAGLFSTLVSWFAQWVTKKVAIAAAAISAFSILTVALFTVLSLSISLLVSSFPNHVLQTILWLAIPDQVPLAVASVIAADTAIALYTWNVQNVKLAAWVT